MLPAAKTEGKKLLLLQLFQYISKINKGDAVSVKKVSPFLCARKGLHVQSPSIKQFSGARASSDIEQIEYHEKQKQTKKKRKERKKRGSRNLKACFLLTSKCRFQVIRIKARRYNMGFQR